MNINRLRRDAKGTNVVKPSRSPKISFFCIIPLKAPHNNQRERRWITLPKIRLTFKALDTSTLLTLKRTDEIKHSIRPSTLPQIAFSSIEREIPTELIHLNATKRSISIGTPPKSRYTSYQQEHHPKFQCTSIWNEKITWRRTHSTNWQGLFQKKKQQKKNPVCAPTIY